MSRLRAFMPSGLPYLARQAVASLETAVRVVIAGGAGMAIMGLSACSNHEMHQQVRFDPLEPAAAWPDSQSALRPPAGTVDRAGEAAVADTAPFPGPPDARLLQRGRERYAIFCAPCHGAYGDGDGMITRHGFPNPPS